MSDKYKHGDTVPSDELCKRLHELSDAVTKGPQAVAREFGMRIPAELDRDADLVLSQAAIRIAALEAQLAAERERVKTLEGAIASHRDSFTSESDHTEEDRALWSALQATAQEVEP